MEILGGIGILLMGIGWLIIGVTYAYDTLKGWGSPKEEERQNGI